MPILKIQIAFEWKTLIHKVTWNRKCKNRQNIWKTHLFSQQLVWGLYGGVDQALSRWWTVGGEMIEGRIDLGLRLCMWLISFRQSTSSFWFGTNRRHRTAASMESLKHTRHSHSDLYWTTRVVFEQVWSVIPISGVHGPLGLVLDRPVTIVRHYNGQIWAAHKRRVAGGLCKRHREGKRRRLTMVLHVQKLLVRVFIVRREHVRFRDRPIAGVQVLRAGPQWVFAQVIQALGFEVFNRLVESEKLFHQRQILVHERSLKPRRIQLKTHHHH